MENRSVKHRKKLVNRSHSGLSVRRQCELLSVCRSSVYYQPLGESAVNLTLMKEIDRIFMAYPTFGVLRMQDELFERGYQVNQKRVRRLMRKMGIEPVYPKKNLSRRGKARYIHPYLLRLLTIADPDQVWAIDITYIPMERGFMYLTAVIDIYSRYLVGWDLHNSLDKKTQTILLQQIFNKYGKPAIINSDQGSQYTCAHWENFLGFHEIKISMDGKGRATDNCYIERFFRTLKWDYVYLNPATDGMKLYKGIKEFVRGYNRRRHQGIGRQKPIDLYLQNKNTKHVNEYKNNKNKISTKKSLTLV